MRQTLMVLGISLFTVIGIILLVDRIVETKNIRQAISDAEVQTIIVDRVDFNTAPQELTITGHDGETITHYYEVLDPPGQSMRKAPKGSTIKYKAYTNRYGQDDIEFIDLDTYADNVKPTALSAVHIDTVEHGDSSVIIVSTDGETLAFTDDIEHTKNYSMLNNAQSGDTIEFKRQSETEPAEIIFVGTQK